MKKRVFATVLLLAMMAGILPGIGSAEAAEPEGVWNLVSMTMRGEPVDLMEKMGGSAALVMRGSHTCTLYAGDGAQAVSSIWSWDGSVGTISIYSDSDSFTIEGDRLVFVGGQNELVFERGEDAPVEASVGDGKPAGEWELVKLTDWASSITPGELGGSAHLTMNDDGSFVLDIDIPEQESTNVGTWTWDGANGSVNIYGQAYPIPFVLEGSRMTVSEGDSEMLFERPNAGAPLGEWRVMGAAADGGENAVEALGGSGTLTMYMNGSCALDADADGQREHREGSWIWDGERGEITLDGRTLPFTLEDGQMSLAGGGRLERVVASVPVPQLPENIDWIDDFHEGFAFFKVGGLYGLVNDRWEVICEPQWLDVSPFSEGQARVMRSNINYIIDTQGNVLYLGTFGPMEPYSDGLVLRWNAMRVNRVTKYIFDGFTDTAGNMVIEPLWDWADSFSYGLAPVGKDDKYGFIDTAGNVVFELQWDGAGRFSDGLAPVKRDDVWGYIDTTGNVVIDYAWEDAQPFSEGLATVMRDGQYGLIDTAGNVIAQPQWDGIEPFSDGLAQIEHDGKYGLIDTSGNVVSQPQWDGIEAFQDGLAQVKKDGAWGLIDTTGNVVSDPRWDDIGEFSEGFASVRQANKYGFIDTTGNVVVEPQWDGVGPFSEGLAWVCVGSRVDTNWYVGDFGFIDTSGNVVIEPQWESVNSFSDGLASVRESTWSARSRKWGFIDVRGNMVIEPQWDNVSAFKNGYALVMDWVGEESVSRVIDRMGEYVEQE